MSYAEEPKIGPTEGKKPAILNMDHHMLHKSDEMAPGDPIKLIVHGHIHSNENKSDFGPGHLVAHLHTIEYADKPATKKNASNMRLDELRKQIKDMSNRDEDMEGHVEDGIKEEGNDEHGKKAN